MATWIVVLGCIVWYATGVSGFVYWWTREFDLGADIELLLALVAGVCGPLSWLVFALDREEPYVIIRKRGA